MIKKEKYIVLVKNLILKASVGIYPKEKIRKQKVRFNISITANDNIKTKNGPRSSNMCIYVYIIIYIIR